MFLPFYQLATDHSDPRCSDTLISPRHVTRLTPPSAQASSPIRSHPLPSPSQNDDSSFSLPHTTFLCVSGFATPSSIPQSQQHLSADDRTCLLRNLYLRNGRLFSLQPSTSTTSPSPIIPDIPAAYDTRRRKVLSLRDLISPLTRSKVLAQLGSAQYLIRKAGLQILSPLRLPHYRSAAHSAYAYHPHALVDILQPAYFGTAQLALALSRNTSILSSPLSTHPTSSSTSSSSSSSSLPSSTSSSSYPSFSHGFSTLFSDLFVSSCSQALIIDDGNKEPTSTSTTLLPNTTQPSSLLPRQWDTSSSEALWSLLFGAPITSTAPSNTPPLAGYAPPNDYDEGPLNLLRFWNTFAATSETSDPTPPSSTEQNSDMLPSMRSFINTSTNQAIASSSPLITPLKGLPPVHSLYDACPPDALCLIPDTLVPSSSYGFYHHTSIDYSWKERALLALRWQIQYRFNLWPLSSPSPSSSPSSSSSSSLSSSPPAPSSSASRPLIALLDRDPTEVGVHCPHCCVTNMNTMKAKLSQVFPQYQVEIYIPGKLPLRYGWSPLSFHCTPSLPPFSLLITHKPSYHYKTL